MPAKKRRSMEPRSMEQSRPASDQLPFLLDIRSGMNSSCSLGVVVYSYYFVNQLLNPFEVYLQNFNIFQHVVCIFLISLI